MKLWEKGTNLSKEIEQFTVGMDRELDIWLAHYDVLGSLAHTTMLAQIGLLDAEESKALRQELLAILSEVQQGDFTIDEGVEDVHSQVELQLTQALGDVGKKIHSGRSRNDQVLVDLKLYLRDELRDLTELTAALSEVLLGLSEKHKDVIIPGYTHLQAAMPSSIGLWLGAYAETFVDDLKMLLAAFQIVNQNPLGSAAGYGNSFPLDRELTTELLGFEYLHVNSIAAQLSRGKTEMAVSCALAALALTSNKLASDLCLYNSQNFGFIKFPDHITTGSSIMPHKKNPDVFELLRAQTNLIQQLPQQIGAVCSNLPSGYHRDFQLTKEVLLPGIQKTKQCLNILTQSIQEIEVNEEVMNDDRYDLIYSVENVNQQVLAGVPFRAAYQQIAQDIEKGQYQPLKKLQHTHIGSIGNLGTSLIRIKLQDQVQAFNFDRYQEALNALTA